TMIAASGQHHDLAELADPLPALESHAGFHRRNAAVQVLHSAALRPDEGAQARGSVRRADHPSFVVDAERPTRTASRKGAQIPHASAARPEKGAHARRSAAETHDLSGAVDVDGFA